MSDIYSPEKKKVIFSYRNHFCLLNKFSTAIVYIAMALIHATWLSQKKKKKNIAGWVLNKGLKKAQFLISTILSSMTNAVPVNLACES